MNAEVKPGYKQSEIGVIPEDWNTPCLGQLVHSVEYGSSTKSSLAGKVPVLRMGNLQEGKIDWGDLVFSDNSREIARFLLNRGDVLFNRTNTPELVGKTSIYKGETPAIFAGYLIRIKENKDLLDSTYLNYVLNAEFSKKHGQKILSVAVGQANINGQKLKTYPIPLPPSRAEQEAISSTLTDIETLISGLDQLIAKKRDIQQAAMQQLLTGQRRLPGFSGAWSRHVLRDLVSTPVTDGPHETPRFVENGIPFLSVNNIANNRIDFRDLRFISREDHLIYSKKCRPQRNDLLLGKAASVGKVALIETDVELNIWSPIALIRMSDAHDPRYFYYAFRSKEIGRQIEVLTNSSSQGNIGMGDIERLFFSVPNLAEQTAIASLLSDMDTEIAALEARRDKARQLKQGMMQELLTGRIRLV